MTEISAQLVKDLRTQTGAGMMDCKEALKESGGDVEKAISVLRKKGLKNVGKRAAKVAAEGLVYAYIHAGGKIGVMLELNSETDFVARGEDFSDLAKAISMHIAWANPSWVSRGEVPAAVLEQEQEIIRAQLKPEQAKMADKIISGKLEKFYEDNCLVDQFDARDPNAKKRIGDLVNELSAKVGEKIVLRRFQRFVVGEGLESPDKDDNGAHA